MKSLNNRNIAVCFSGQSRTFEHCVESIKTFFSSGENNTFSFFCHTWDVNSYTTCIDNKTEYIDYRIDIKELEQKLNSAFDFKKLVIDNAGPNNHFESMFYSIMRSNLLKQQYEVENNMMFDFVIRARLDTCYRPGLTYELIFNNAHCIREKCLYSYFSHMNNEFFLPNLDGILYAGTSLTMDLIDSLYNALHTESFYKLLNFDIHNPAYKAVGPGVLIYKWMTLKNILPVNTNSDRAVYRRAAIGIDPIKDWNRVVEMRGIV